MMNQYIKELEQDPFDPDEFVERMVRRSMQESRLQDDQFDPEMIHDIFTQAIQDLKHCVNVFSSLDERMSRCGGRALDVGEKLGAARAPRARAAAARDLLSHLANFLSPGPVVSDLFNDPNKLNEAADVIQKLFTIAQELPPDKFEVAKKKIEAKYDEIERNLIEEFVRAQNQGNVAKMKDIATIMTNFKGYSQCVDAYIETSQMNTLLGKDIFSAVLPLCKKNYTVISSVFPNPDQVISKFVLNIFHLKLQKYIQTKLADKNDMDKYLRNLYDMYISTQKVCDELVAANLVSADGNTATGDLRREALVNGAMAGATDGYASLEIRRLKALCTPNELHGTTIALLDALIQNLLIEHVDYALDLGLQSIPIAENKSPPQIYFFDIVNLANKIVRMFGEHFQESVLPCLSKQGECIQRKNTIMEQLENKLDAGLERAISAIVGWVKLHLQTEQKKTDFKPEGDIDTLASSAELDHSILHNFIQLRSDYKSHKLSSFLKGLS
ncbi:jg20335 [Pararge aegeria aegeria]|uniref:Exocyst complex component 5 n=1 Tax=Pararge aegeria aegeria TaxID=348720 RepID=A0A8S4R944_9NEOP|nr:jg20335 [Pararge aegeria aegeria]